MNKYFSLTAVFVAVIALQACHTNPVTGKKQAFVMSEASEIAMGAKYDPQIVAAYGVYDDEKIQKFIDEKGQLMAKESHRSHLKYEFKIMDSPVVNAFAVPGGYVYFTRGIMAHFNNEAEFAGVLGHEIGHITARHSVVQQRNQTVAQIGLMAGMVLSPKIAAMANEASQGVQLMLLKFGRDAESQSDELGVEYSSKIGYDAREMSDFFGTLARLSAQGGGDQIPTFLSTHPNPLNRKAEVARLADVWRDKLSLTDPAVGREKYLNMLEGLVLGEDPRQGFVENNNFYHPELKFTFPVPVGWKHQNSPQQFQMASADGKAMMLLMIASGASLQEAANSFMADYKLESISSKKETLNGMEAITVIFQQTAKKEDGTSTVSMKGKSTFVKYAGLMFNLSAVAGPAEYDEYVSTFDKTLRNFKKLTQTDKLNRKPDRIHLFRTTVGGTLKQALKGQSISDSRLDEFAILNGMLLGESVPKGTLLKGMDR